MGGEGGERGERGRRGEVIYCPRCRKLVNVNVQVSTIVDNILTTLYCEECGTTISSTKVKVKLEDRRKNYGKAKEQ